jgi:hypothetical protein
MSMRIALPFALGALVLVHAGNAGAKQTRLVNPAVLCVPSAEEESLAPAKASLFSCRLRLSPWFDGASLELTPQFALTPRAVPKRWGAEFELRF